MKKTAIDEGTFHLKNIVFEASRHSYEAAKSELAETKQILEKIIQGITDGIALISKDMKIVWANKAILKETGCLPEEIVGSYCYKKMHKKDSDCMPPHVLCPIKEVIKTGKPMVITHTHLDRHNNTKYVEVAAYPIRNEEGLITHFVHITRDVTEKKAAEEHLKDSELTCRTIFNSVNDAIAIHDINNFKILDINERGTEMLATPGDKIKGLTLEKLTCNKEGYLKNKLSKYFEKAAHNEPQLFEWKFKNRDGRCLWVDISLKRGIIHGEARLISVIRDISKRKETAPCM